MAIKICVLIPSYNVAKTIGSIVKDLKARGLAVYVVDDGSSDNTQAIAEAAGAAVIIHRKNMGKGASLRDGFERALRDGFDAVVVMDGDGQHKADDVGRFLKKAEGSDAAVFIGNRMSSASRMPYIRLATNRFMSSIISKVTGLYIPDSQCGFRLIKREVLDKIVLESSRYEIDSELILKAAHAGFKIESLPIQTVYQNEVSNINPVLDTLRFIALMIKAVLTK